MPPRLPPPPQVSKPGTPPKVGDAESSKPTAEPDAWLLGEIEAMAGAAEASGAKPASEAKAASESSGAKAKPPSEASGAKAASEASAPKPPAKPARSATAALVGIGDDLIANASPEDKPVFSTIIAKAEAKSASSEPAVFDELGLAKTPAVITGHTVREMDASAKDDDGKIVVGAAPPAKKTDEGFPVPPPNPIAPKPATTATASKAASATASPSTSTSRGAKPMSRWTPHVLLGTLGLASIIAIAFRCSGTSTSTASADAGKKAPVVAKAGDDLRGASAASDAAASGGGANGGANGGADAAEGGDAKGNGAADDDDVQVDGEDKAGGGGQAEGAQAEGGDAAGGGTPTEDAAAKDDAAKDDAAADAAAKDDAQAAAAPTDGGGAAKDTTPASTSSKSKSRSSSPTPIAPSTPSPDANLTAEELLELARKAWAAGNSRDTYKYANKSRYKKNSAEATELATLSACKLKLEKSAKSSFDSLSGDKRRKVRQKCRDWGVWVGI